MSQRRSRVRSAGILADNADPHAALVNESAEAAVVAAVLIDNRLGDRLADKVDPQDFGTPLFGRLYALIITTVARGEPANIVSLRPQLDGDDELTALGGRAYLVQLTSSAASLIGAADLADQVRTLARRRRLVAGLAAATAIVEDGSASDEEVADAVDSALSGSLLGEASRPALTIAKAYDLATDQLAKLSRGEVPRGIMVAVWHDWNDLTGGMHPGQIIVLAGRPSMGKTAAALTVGRRAAESGHGVLLISREMETAQVMPRIMADMLFDEGGIATFEDIQSGRVGAADFSRLAAIRDRIKDWPFVIEDPSTLPVERIAPLIRRQQRAFAARGQKLELVIIDYLGLIEPAPGRSSREQDVAGISLALKTAARAAGVAILVLSQLNRAVEQREDKHPMLSDLRDSGAIEQDADVVIFVYRAEYYLERSAPDASQTAKHDAWQSEMLAARDRIELYSAKARQRALGKRTGYFFGNRQAIRNSDFYRSGYP